MKNSKLFILILGLILFLIVLATPSFATAAQAALYPVTVTTVCPDGTQYSGQTVCYDGGTSCSASTYLCAK